MTNSRIMNEAMDAAEAYVSALEQEYDDSCFDEVAIGLFADFVAKHGLSEGEADLASKLFYRTMESETRSLLRSMPGND